MAAQSVPRAFQAHIPPLLPSQRLLFQAVSVSNSLSSRFKQRETAQTMVFAFLWAAAPIRAPLTQSLLAHVRGSQSRPGSLILFSDNTSPWSSGVFRPLQTVQRSCEPCSSSHISRLGYGQTHHKPKSGHSCNTDHDTLLSFTSGS